MCKVPERFHHLISRFTQMSKEILGENLKGIYLHGSAAMGCFNPKKSDLDLLLVVEHGMGKGEKLRFMEQVVRLNQEAPSKGIEFSIVLQENCRPFVYPTPFELHFSNAHLKWFLEHPEDYVERMKGTDRDLAAHVMIVNHYGVVLYGQPVSEMLGLVFGTDYWDSIWNDIKDAGESVRENPVYVILNLCRVLGYAKEKLVLSKRSGDRWGMGVVPERYHILIEKVMACYESGEDMEADKDEDVNVAAEFAGYMLNEIDRCWSYTKNNRKLTGGCHDIL